MTAADRARGPAMNGRAHDLDTLVIGGGVVGLSLACGLARAGERVRLLDEADDAFRAARGNFGLVWVQGKGLGRAAYARWTMDAARVALTALEGGGAAQPTDWRPLLEGLPGALFAMAVLGAVIEWRRRTFGRGSDAGA